MSKCSYNDIQYISIHAPPRGATDWVLNSIKNLDDFNSRPSARGDTKPVALLCALRFQFTPLREGRRTLPKLLCIAGTYFNSRPSARGDAAEVRNGVAD